MTFILLPLMALVSTTLAQSLPIVDLGYIRQQATAINSTGGYYNFSNIRYGQEPTGPLRFALPVAVSGTNTSIDNGSIARICPQANPDWEAIAEAFIPDYLLGTTSSFDFAKENATAFSMPPAAQSADATEDCLFLDVFVPEKVFEGNTSAPVLVWIYGGGFTEGSKVSSGSPAGLIKASQTTGGDGLVFVAMNYRLGALGWLAGATIEASGVANAGLYDQRLALDWVQSNIHLFGGDANKVTVMGESAGAASIFHQITAFGNGTTAPFQQAIIQSPAFQPFTNPTVLEATTQDFLSILGVNSIEEARGLDSATVIAANSKQVSDSPYGSFTYGPAVDNLIAPALPGQLVAEGRFDKSVKVMIGHNEDEGLLFTDPIINTTAAYTEYLQEAFPSISLSAVAYIEDVLYPADFSDESALQYDTFFTRSVETVQEFAVTCNTWYLEKAFNYSVFAYQFDIFPALHGEDVGYTFYDGSTTDTYGLALNGSIARVFQAYLTSFVISGTPVAAGYETFPEYTSARKILNVLGGSVELLVDDVNATRCNFWQQGLFNGQEVSVDGVGISEGVASAIITTASNGAATYTGSVIAAVSPAPPVAEIIPASGANATVTVSSASASFSSATASKISISTTGIVPITAPGPHISSSTTTSNSASLSSISLAPGPYSSVATTSSGSGNYSSTFTATTSSTSFSVTPYAGGASVAGISRSGVIGGAICLIAGIMGAL